MSVLFIDTEFGTSLKKHDFGACSQDGSSLHTSSLREFIAFTSSADFLCGHNILRHDLPLIKKLAGLQDKTDAEVWQAELIDTLPLSVLLFPLRRHHALGKDEKLALSEANNPLNDCRKAEQLLYEEAAAFQGLPGDVQRIYRELLGRDPAFAGFFSCLDSLPVQGGLSQDASSGKAPEPEADEKSEGLVSGLIKSLKAAVSSAARTAGKDNLKSLITQAFAGRICTNADIDSLISRHPVELAYALSVIRAADDMPAPAPWLLFNYPFVEEALRILRTSHCAGWCAYCQKTHDASAALRQIFGYEAFRTYSGEPLQEKAVRAAVAGRSLLAVFPTGGGKSLTFQLPALMAGRAVRGLTIVISPLQALMKDQVDNLAAMGITDAVTVNGLLDPIERAASLERIASGAASILYISPESLRSPTIEKLLLERTVLRFVIDEAHCFSAWGQDFRVDYLYIGKFIKKLQEARSLSAPIPVSCFTATAKQKVISDIRDYFARTLDLSLDLFASSAARDNLRYTVLYKETEDDKYSALRSLLGQKTCPAIVYVSRTRKAERLAEKLASDGFSAGCFHGRMEASAKTVVQEAFARNELQIIVATSAFGMGVDKKDVGLVVHYDISGSLEDYVQEAGRAGRDPAMQADCFVLYTDKDLDSHFLLLNQNKLSISEIQQVWKAVKHLTRQRMHVSCSALEIAREAGWDDTGADLETRVKTAVSALEQAGYVQRGRNAPRVYATSILAHDMNEAQTRIEKSALFTDEQKEQARRIIKSLISSRSIARAGNADAESRVDYLADMLGMTKAAVISSVNLMRQEGLLADTKDMTAFLQPAGSAARPFRLLERFAGLEDFLLEKCREEGAEYELKELNEQAQEQGLASTVKDLRTLLNFLAIRQLVNRQEHRLAQEVSLVPCMSLAKLKEKCSLRHSLCRFFVQLLYDKASATEEGRSSGAVQFSLVELHKAYMAQQQGQLCQAKVLLSDVEEALLYLSRTGVLKIEGGFLVLYNAMDLKRTEQDNRKRYTREDYRFLDEFYKQRIRQIHIVGEYANLMVHDYEAALQFVQDYFQMDFKAFISRYFKGERAKDLERNITAAKYRQLFGALSPKQAEILNDQTSRCIVVAAGPGSGKTRLLVHKLASLLLMEDVRHEQLLMLTFSRAAATEFKKRLTALIGHAAGYVEISTFHSYCFDLLGRKGSLEESDQVVERATELLKSGGVEPGRITKSVLVIDEAQDMDAHEFAFVTALMQVNEEMRVIAVGDDDQNIFSFRGSDSRFFASFASDYGASVYEMTENYRSGEAIVSFANAYASTIRQRMKKTPCLSQTRQAGCVRITEHAGMGWTEAVADDLVQEMSAQGSGSASRCVLTRTNEEALLVLGCLQGRGIKAQLIQSLNSFSLLDLMELRYFLKVLHCPVKGEAGSGPAVLDQGLWEEAKERIKKRYAKSTCLPVCLRLLQDFEETHPERYRSDLEDFIRESRYEDFYGEEKGTVLVSTMHKAKGREFDKVYLLLSGKVQSDEDKRALYVALTRARHELSVHCREGVLEADGFRIESVPAASRSLDAKDYGEPEEIRLELSHKDVVLDFFRGRKQAVFCLCGGSELSVEAGGFLAACIKGSSVPVAKLSKACREHVQSLAKRGYRAFRAEVRCIVAWQKKGEAEEWAVLLPTLFFTRKPR